MHAHTYINPLKLKIADLVSWFNSGDRHGRYFKVAYLYREAVALGITGMVPR